MTDTNDLSAAERDPTLHDAPATRTMVAGGLILVGLLDAALLVVLWPSVSGINDFVGLLAGGRAILDGVDPYRPSGWTAFATTIGQVPETPVFGYPPWTALFFVPFALLPTALASIVWTAGGLAVATAACAALARRAGWPVVATALLASVSWPAILVFLQGQWGYVLVALTVGVLFAVESGRAGRAGVLWGLMVLAKPQLFVLGSLVLGVTALARRRALAVITAAFTIATGVAAGTLAAPGWSGPYLAFVLTKRGARQTQEPTLAGLSGDLAGALWPVVWTAAVVVLALLVASAARSIPRPERERVFVAGVITLSVLAAPYSWSYDHYLAVVLGAATLGLASALVFRRRVALTAAVVVLFGPVAFALWESSYVRWHDTLAALVPVSAIILAWIAARWSRKEAVS